VNQNGLGRSPSLNQNAAGVAPFVLDCRSKAYPALCYIDLVVFVKQARKAAAAFQRSGAAKSAARSARP
jgi:hypothetical protein